MLGEFKILRRLGRGGMATVYLAEQTSLHRNVAVKVLFKELVADNSYLERFRIEAKAAAGLNHPNIVQVYVIGEQDGIGYIAQEYVQGMNLREFLKKKGTPDLPVALHILKQVAAALQAASAAGIVHRDIKPENIMLTRKGEVKVADFGLARVQRSGEEMNLTAAGETMGTPLYMSPEQIQGDRLDARSDIYSFGVTAYCLLAGAPPFKGETALSIALQHLNKEPPNLQEQRPDLPAALCQIVHKMMAKSPADRYPDAQSVLKDLKRLSQARSTGQPFVLDVSASQSSVPEPPKSFPGRLVGVLDMPFPGQVLRFGVLAAVVAGSAAGVGWVTRPSNPLLEPVKVGNATPRQGSIQLQYMHALRHEDDADAWRAVWEQFPDGLADESIRRRAKEHFAMLSLRNRQFDEAMTVFQEFSDLPGTQAEWVACGLAGKGIVASLNRQYQESQALFRALRIQGLHLRLSPRMSDLFEARLRENLHQLNQENEKQWQELLNGGESDEK
jgi:serine/threonine-protein kinase